MYFGLGLKRKGRAVSEILRQITDEAQQALPEMIAIRRDFHAHPELSFQEVRTSEKVASTLDGIGLEVKRNIATTGVVGLLRGASDGPTIALRADMDALPVEEKTGLPFASENPGVMHACNHDGHVAMLLGAAMVLNNMRETLRGNVKFIFQPGEEGFAGARQMIEAGVLEDEPQIEAAFAIHLDPMSDSGMFAVRGGPIMACADMFTLTIVGKGGHGAMPHTTIDPVFVSAHVITALQGISSRQVSAVDSIVVSICTVRTSEGMTIIPDTVELGGTVRLFNPDLRKKMPSMMKQIIEGVTSAFGAKYDLSYIHGYPATVNDAEFAEMTLSAAGDVLGGENARRLKNPRMPSEDFSFFLEKVPGAFAILGARPADKEPAPSHSPVTDIDETVLAQGAKVHAAVALRYLEVL
jgi:amidohydrolase